MKKITKKVLSLLLIITMVTVHFIAPIRVLAEETVRVTIDVNGGNELTQNYIDGIKGHTLMEMVGDLEEGPLLYSFLNLRKPRTYLEAVINSDTEEPIDPENDPINEDTSIKFLWEQSELYDGAVSVQVDAPHIGDEYEVNEVMEPDQLVIAYYDQAPTPSMATDFEVFNIDFDNRMLLYYTDDCKNAGLDPYDNAECLQPFAGTIEEGETYYISFVISINDKYFMTNDISEVLTVNGEEPQFIQAAGYENEDFKAANVIIEMQAVEGNGNNEEGEFTITYDTDGGTNIAPEYVHDNEKAPQPNPNPEKEHYIFGGWYSDSERNNLYDFDDPVHEDRTIYAKWEEKNISITTSPNSIKYGEIQTNPEDHIQRVVKVTNNGNTNVTLTLTNPTSDGPFGSLGFNSIDLDVGASIDVTLIVNKNADKAGIPGEYSGNYVFTASDCGGDGEFSVNVPATVTIVQNTPQVHTVTFDTDGGTSIGSVTVNHGDTVSAPEIIPQKDNYEFAMWCSDETKTQPYNFGNAVTSDITIYAKYNPVQQGGNDPEPALISLTTTSVDFGTFTVGSESDLYRTVKVSNDSQVDVEITVSSPTEQGPFYALEIQPFVVEAGQEQNVNLIVDHGSSKTSLPGTYNGQYVFNYKEVGAESGEEILVNATVVVEEAEPATPEKVTVSFETYGGTPVPEAREIDKGSIVSAPTTNPAKDNYEFDAWCFDETATQPYDFTQPVNSSMTLYAKYNPIQQGGNDPQPTEVNVTVSPSSVNFGTLYTNATEDLTQDVTITNDSDVAVEVMIDSPTTDGPFNIHAENNTLTIPANNSATLTLSVDHGANQAIVPGTYNGVYTFSYNEVGVQLGDSVEVTASVTVADPEPAAPEKVIVTFEANGGTPVPTPVEIDKGTAVSAPTTNPAKDNYEFDAWCFDETATQPYDFTQPVNSSMTLYAKYNPVQQGGTSSGNNDELVILDNTNNQDYNPEDDDADEGLTIRVSGELSDLIKIEVDGEEVSSSDVSLISGSTIATFAQSFLNTLSNGAHTVTFYFGSGNINATFNIQRTAANTNTTTNTTTTTQGTTNNSNNPGTNDNIVKWVSLFGVSVLALSGVVLLKKKL